MYRENIDANKLYYVTNETSKGHFLFQESIP
jgi:hypothetical protein